MPPSPTATWGMNEPPGMFRLGPGIVRSTESATGSISTTEPSGVAALPLGEVEAPPADPGPEDREAASAIAPATTNRPARPTSGESGFRSMRSATIAGLVRLERGGPGFAVDLGHGEHLVLALEALQGVDPAVLEPDPLAGDRVADGPGHQDLTGSSQRHDPGGGVDGGAAHLRAHHLGLAEVDPGPDLQPESADPVGDLHGGPDGLGRAGEDREEAVAGSVEFAAPVAPQDRPDHPVVGGDQARPPPVPTPPANPGGGTKAGKKNQN